MNICFSIHYVTQWGQEVRLVGSSPQLGEWDPHRAPPMTFTPGGHWILDVDVAKLSALPLSYKYCVVHPGGGIEWEAGGNRVVGKDIGRPERVWVSDTWRPAGALDQPLTTAAFTRAILGGHRRLVEGASKATARSGARCRFRVIAPRVEPDYAVCVIGSDAALGEWEEAYAVVLSGKDFPEWHGEVRLKDTSRPIEYKYGVYDTARSKVVRWETGANRVIGPELGKRSAGLKLRHDGWLREGLSPWRGAGVAVPVFSLRSERGLGVGEFADIKLMVDWAHETGLSLIQLLPVNDTVATHTWVDSYPYAAVSVFALHPIYMRLEDMGVFDAETTRTFVGERRAELNALADVDYEAVMGIKSRYFKAAYDASRDRFLKDPDYRAFFEDHHDWLMPYAVFSCLRDRYSTSNYNLWPAYRTITRDELERFADPGQSHFDDVAVHYFIQYHLHRQLLDAATYARSRGVALKGDIPIGVYRHSVDTWIDRRSFNLDAQAGAPPDAFAIDGQNWGFPTYNWEAMAKDGFSWWRRRLMHLAEYFDAFRIDHILGFFRIWEIPLEQVQGILGHFSPAFTVTRGELNWRGIGWDGERLAQPYIRRHMLEPIFGAQADWVAAEFLDETQPGCFRMKEPFRTQRGVEDYLRQDAAANPAHAARNEAVKWGLFRLIADRVFVPEPSAPTEAYYPRSTMHNTWSYNDLDEHTRWRLNALYIDYFYKRHEQFWRDQAMVRLPAIRSATNMLICGEDLGMVPDCVPGVMQDLGILSLYIQRMPKDPKQAFSHPADCPYLSVCSPSTHDMSTIRGWWEEDREQTQRFFNEIMGRAGAAPAYCEPEIVRDILVQHLYSPSMWAIVPVQDFLGLDPQWRRRMPQEERINVPSNPQHYWRYRLHVNLEELVGARELNGNLKALVAKSGRAAEA